MTDQLGCIKFAMNIVAVRAQLLTIISQCKNILKTAYCPGK